MAASWSWEDVWALYIYGSQDTRNSLHPQLIEIMQKLPRTDLKKALKDAPDEIASQFVADTSGKTSKEPTIFQQTKLRKHLAKEIIRLSCGGY